MSFPSNQTSALVSIGLTLTTLRCASNDSAPGEPRRDAASEIAQSDVADPAPPSAESGLVDVPAQTTSFLSPSRMFYSFQPTQTTDPTPKPLLVFFNGGPGTATSTCLLSYGTGRFTLDRPGIANNLPRPNDHTFARFAHLLYVDARNTGFSYSFRSSKDDVGNCSDFLVEDAIDFIRVVLRFLANHRTLLRSPIVLVGESYGGMRALAIAHLLLHYDDPSAPIPDDLRVELRRHFDAFWPERAGQTHPMVDIGGKLVRLVLIQPSVGGMQQVFGRFLIDEDPYLGPLVKTQMRSLYDVREDQDWVGRLEARAMEALADTEASRALFGSELGQLPQIWPKERRDAYRPGAAFDSTVEAAFQERFGSLRLGDGFLAKNGDVCSVLGTGNPATVSDQTLPWLIETLRFSRLFVTNARHDGAIQTRAIAQVLQTVGSEADVDLEPRAGVVRPGWIRARLAATSTDPETTVAIRFPAYEDAGHMVTVKQGADLADDVAQWLAEP